MAPDFQSLELFSAWDVEFLSIFLLAALLVNLE
jgi:hypothetical protein